MIVVFQKPHSEHTARKVKLLSFIPTQYRRESLIVCGKALLVIDLNSSASLQMAVVFKVIPPNRYKTQRPIWLLSPINVGPGANHVVDRPCWIVPTNHTITQISRHKTISHQEDVVR